MFKQVYRLLAVMLISNLFFSQGILGKQLDNVNNVSNNKAFSFKNLFKHNSNKQKTNVQKPDYDYSTGAITRYGVFPSNKVMKTYPDEIYKESTTIKPSQNSGNNKKGGKQ